MQNSEPLKSGNEVDAKLSGKFLFAPLSADLDLVSAARGLGISLSEYSAYERGHTRISATAIAKMSRLTTKPIGWFFEVEKMELGKSLWKTEANQRRSTIPTRIAALVTLLRQNQDE